MPTGYTSLTIEERTQLSLLAEQGLSRRAIAAQMGRSTSTICRKLARNATLAGPYRVARAQAMATQRRATSRAKSRKLGTAFDSPLSRWVRIKRFTDVVFTDAEVARLVATLQAGALPRTRATRQAHLASLRSRHASTTTCPKCGGALVRRTARSGAKAGQAFLGCSAFPTCRHTRPVDDGA